MINNNFQIEIFTKSDIPRTASESFASCFSYTLRFTPNPKCVTEKGASAYIIIHHKNKTYHE